MDALLYWYTIILQEVPICNETNQSYNPQFLYRLWHLLSKSMVHSQTRHLTKFVLTNIGNGALNSSKTLLQVSKRNLK